MLISTLKHNFSWDTRVDMDPLSFITLFPVLFLKNSLHISGIA